MGRILAIDYGKKRTGLAVTDPMKIIANGLDTIATQDIWKYLDVYLARETVEGIVVGYPLQMNNELSDSVAFVGPFIKKLTEKYPAIHVATFDERFTSKMAFQTMIDAGLGKKDRQNKSLIDKISATIILQDYLESIKEH
jgi:putative holliday junction resolvase